MREPEQAALSATPESGEKSECGCSAKSGAKADSPAALSYVYAIGRIEPRFPSRGVEKEFAQATGRTGTVGLTDREALHKVLTEPENRYLVRQLCWVLTVEGVETYLLMPRDPIDFKVLVEAVRPAPRPTDVDVVIGVRGPVAPPTACNGLMLPMVGFDHIYSFDIDSLLKAIPRPEEVPADRFEASAEELFARLSQVADNAGATDEHRALNYVAVRYHAIYAAAADAYARNAALRAIETRPSRLSGARKILDVIFTYASRDTDVAEKQFVRVDVTEEFPFLVSKLAPFYDR